MSAAAKALGNCRLFCYQGERSGLKHTNVKEMLIDRAIAVLGSNGMDKATTKAIVADTGISEVYIYRHFANKEDLLTKAFEKLDEELAQKTLLHIHVMYVQSMEYRERCRFFFTAVWEFLLRNQIKCTAYIRYYYSPYFSQHSADAHKERFMPLVDKFQEAFKDDANTWMLLNHILATMLDFAMKVYEGQLPNNDDTTEHVFRIIYYSVSPYFKRSGEEPGENRK